MLRTICALLSLLDPDESVQPLAQFGHEGGIPLHRFAVGHGAAEASLPNDGLNDRGDLRIAVIVGRCRRGFRLHDADF